MSSSSSSSSAAASVAGGDAAAPGEEGILVAIRMRPLNSREQTTQNSRVWRVLQKYNSVTQCTSVGKPLPERIHNRTFFSYDKTFGESSTTRQVYEQTSRGIVDSVASGLNGTIFAYGQTSSGKTFTMQGSGSLQDGASSGGGSSVLDNGGIVHMAASDIFNHIEMEPERVFLVRVSFIEIYNEEVRDLLVSGDSVNNATLKIREDKDRGVFVNSNETIVTSMDSLLSVLFAGEKNRSFAATAMNERSSRSHTIFRITVESRLKDTKKNGEDDDGEDSDEEDLLRGNDTGKSGAVRVSTLNLVDLAGSESVRHTGATGDRQKEGGIINQSLLTLSRVIGSLGQNATHVNFRDSKLTRILQPSLSGNARMAIICCATPSELYLEETRSTLQFASRAKLVKTRAKVNEVMDDRSLIKKLQRELKEARNVGAGKDTMEQMKALEEKAANAEFASRKAEEDLKRMKELIMKGGVLGKITANGSAGKLSLYNSLFVYNDNDETIQTGAVKFSLSNSTKSRKRRYSDGGINDTENSDPQQLGPYSSPARGGDVTKLHAQTEMKLKRTKQAIHIMPSDIMTDDIDVGLLREALAAKSAQTSSLKAKLEEATRQAQSATEKLQVEQGEREMLRLANQDLESQVSSLASDKEFVVTEQNLLIAEKDIVISTSLEKIEQMSVDCSRQVLMVLELQSTVTSLQDQLTEKKEEATAKEAEASSAILQLSQEVLELRTARAEAEDHASALEVSFGAKRQEVADKLSEMAGELEASQDLNTKLTGQTAYLQQHSDDITRLLKEKELAFEEATATIAALKEDAMSLKSQLSADVNELRNANNTLNDRVITLEGDLVAERLTAKEQGQLSEIVKNDMAMLNEKVTDLSQMNEELQTSLLEVTRVKDEHATELHDTNQTLRTTVDEKDKLCCQLSEVRAKYDSIQSDSKKLEHEHKEEISQLKATILQKDDEANALNENIVSLNSRIASLCDENMTIKSERDELSIRLGSTAQEMSSMKEEVSNYSADVSKLGASVEALRRERDAAIVNMNEILTHNGVAEEVLLSLKSEKEELASSLGKTNLAVSRLEAEKGEAVASLHCLHENMVELNCQNKCLSEELDVSKAKSGELESQIKAAAATFDAKVTEHKQCVEELERITGEYQILASDLANVEAKSKNAVANLEERVRQKTDEVCALNEIITSSNDQIAHLTVQLSTLTEERDELAMKLEEVTLEKDELGNRLALKEEDVSNYSADVSTLEASVETLSRERDAAIANMNEMLTHNGVAEEVLSSLKSEKEELASSSEKTNLAVSRLEAEKEKSNAKIAELNSTIVDFQSRNAHLIKDVQTSKSELNELLSRSEKSTADYQSLELEMGDCLKQLQMATDEKVEIFTKMSDEEARWKEVVADLEGSLADKILEINRLHGELHSLANPPTLAENCDGGSDDVDSLKKEIIDLKSLLASANACVHEARSAALSTDQELEEKELQLENALGNLAEQEEARRIAEDKIRSVEMSHRNSSTRSDSEEELLRDMEFLMGEKIDAESRLDHELSRRKEVEDEIKRAAEEEKQLLMDDAEEKMISLRDEISQLKSDLSRVESDCYSRGEENADLQDTIKKVVSRSAESERVVASIRDELSKEQSEKICLQNRLQALEEQSAAFKTQVFEAKASFEANAQARLSDVEEQLNCALYQLSESRKEVKLSRERILDLNNDIEQYRKEIDSFKCMASNDMEMEVSKIKEELAQTKLDLSHSEADCLSAKRELESAKEKVDSVKRHEHEKQQKFAAKAKEAIEILKDRLTKAESTQHASKGVETLHAEVKELTQTLCDKDARIKKLEKSKITKSQIANIQKLKDERSQFMAEAREFKQRVEELENSLPRRSGLRERTDSSQDQSKVIQQLQDDFRQCENKLRKYVQHSERLEKDRKGVIEAISSCAVANVVGDSVVEMVVSLCEKLTSIEEECAALSSSEEKAAEYLTELDSLHEKYSALERQLKSYEDDGTMLTSALAECKANLKKAQEKISALMKDNESLKSMAESAKGNISELQSERRRQMQYLENENLQLGDELKRARRELAAAKSAVDAFQKDAFSNDEPTEELRGLSNLLGATSTKLAPTESASKRVPFQSTSKSIPLRSSQKRCPESPRSDEESNYTEKENLLNKKQRILSSSTSSPFGSEKKKRIVNPFSSVKKASRRTKNALTDNTPTKQYALGDSEPTVDVTGECKQS